MPETTPGPNPPSPRPARRWATPPSAVGNTYRFAFRLIGIPILAVAGVLIYRGLRDRLVLPECDSERAKRTLAQVLKQLQLEPVQYAPIKTVSSSKNEVVCSANMALPGGGKVVVDYTFYWQGDKANMRYSIQRQAAKI